MVEQANPHRCEDFLILNGFSLDNPHECEEPWLYAQLRTAACIEFYFELPRLCGAMQ
jgi:hypothetical protein